jgi:hypothetical protein
VIVKKIGRRNPPKRLIQKYVIEQFKKSGMDRVELAKSLPTLCRTYLYEYLKGNKTRFFRERQIEWILSVINGRR